MAANRNPREVPGWLALHREVSLVQQLIGSGATALGRANYADKTGEYYNAFFGLSIGIERLAKLILVVDHAIKCGGQLPDQGVIRKYGHRISGLLDKVSEICTHYELELKYSRPTDCISKSIIGCLHDFAAERGRYANFQALGDPNLEAEFEPIRMWWTEVAQPILRQHFQGKRVEKRGTTNAEVIHAMMSDVSFVYYIDESGEIMQDVRTASIRTRQTECAEIWTILRFGDYTLAF